MIGLVLSGGGARGAYQVGVINAIAEIAAKLKLNTPFQIYTGVSAGAINATYLAAGADDFVQTAHKLSDLWSRLHVENVFRSDALSLGRIGMQWMSELSLGGVSGTTPGRALLDTSPLRELLVNNLAFTKIDHLIQKKILHAVAISATDYRTSTSVTFIEGDPLIKTWERARRRSEKNKLRAEHVMASAAIPLLFPPIQVDQRYFGDGCVRNLAPCSPAIHMGAQKLMVIGVRRQTTTLFEQQVIEQKTGPSVARVVNVLLNAVLLDGIELDIERMNRINDFVEKVPKEHQANLNFKPVDYVWVHPSGDIGAIAAKKAAKLPRMIRYLLKGLGPLEDASEIISYLLFEPDFCKELIEMGYADGMRSREQIIQLLTTT